MASAAMLMLLRRSAPAPMGWGLAASRRAFATIDPSTSDSHDDFKPKLKGGAAAAPGGGDVKSLIESDIKAHDVFIYMKGVPQQPQCGFSNMACRVLDAYGG